MRNSNSHGMTMVVHIGLSFTEDCQEREPGMRISLTKFGEIGDVVTSVRDVTIENWDTHDIRVTFVLCCRHAHWAQFVVIHVHSCNQWVSLSDMLNIGGEWGSTEFPLVLFSVKGWRVLNFERTGRHSEIRVELITRINYVLEHNRKRWFIYPKYFT